MQLLQMETKTRIIAVSSGAPPGSSSGGSGAVESSSRNSTSNNPNTGASAGGDSSDAPAGSASLWTPIVIVGEPDCCAQAYNRIVKLVDGEWFRLDSTFVAQFL